MQQVSKFMIPFTKKSCANMLIPTQIFTIVQPTDSRLIADQSVNKNAISDASRYKYLRKPLVQNLHSSSF